PTWRRVSCNDAQVGARRRARWRKPASTKARQNGIRLARASSSALRLRTHHLSEEKHSMIEVQNVSRRYGDFTAVDGISFDVREGEIVGILGPNGAGQATSIRMITGFLPPPGGPGTG